MANIPYQELPLAYWIVFSGILGLIVGSFLNVVIYRLPEMMFKEWENECANFIKEKFPSLYEELSKLLSQSTKKPKDEKFNLILPCSRCPKCGTDIKPWHNIPVVSYLVLKGKCAYCQAPISPRYPSIEAVTGILSALVVGLLGFGPQAALGLIFLWSLIALTMIDIDHYLLPDSITLPLLWLGLIVNYFGTYVTLQDAVLGAVAGYLVLWFVYHAFKLLTGKEGMGFGDFKLLAALGAWMGWQMLPLIIILSSLVGTVIAIGGIVLAGKDKAKPIPFGPYLSIAGVIAFLWGGQILDWYLGASGLSAAP